MRRNSPLRHLLCLSLVIACAAPAAFAAVHDRITTAVSNSTHTVIPNSVHPRARLGTDLGAAPGDTKMEAMTLRFNMTAAQEAALDQLLRDQQDPSSPRYHQWLTPATYAAQFGLSSADIAQVTAWLKSEGFTVTEVANSGSFVRFNGTAAQVNAAFATSIRKVSLNGETHYANLTDASVPAAFANVVMGITGLHNFRLKARIRNHPELAPDYNGTFQGTAMHFMAPGDFYTIYNETPLLTSSITGAGQTIAVMGQVDISTTDVAAFRTAAGLTANPNTVKTYGSDPGAPTCSNDNCFPDDGDLAESSLDVEWAGATAPGASVIFVNSTDVINFSLTDAIDANLAPIISISYGGCEPSWGTSELNIVNALFKLGNSMGITVVAPAGDDGATDCDVSVTSAVEGLAVDFPGSSPYVTSMGGTQFNEGGGSYWNASQLTLAGGTAAPAAPYSALSYVPEAAWSDISGGYFGGAGGGPSEFFTKPYWQKVGNGVPDDASRDVPDLALDASDLHDPLLYCVQNSCSGGFASTISAGDFAGGTSFATPTFAGILALVEQKTGSRIGNANPVIYALANNPTYYVAGANYASNSKVVFNDVTTGTNNSPCTSGTPYCSSTSIGYSAGPGYDLATGWGTVNANALVNSWGLVTPIPVSGPIGTNTSTTVISSQSTTVVAAQPVTLIASVSGAAGATPTGTVQFIVSNTPVGSPVPLSSGVATYTWTTSCSTLGEQVLTASYSGDSLYAGSKGAGITAAGFTTAYSVATPVQVLVTSGSCPNFSLAVSTSSVTVGKGQSPPYSATGTLTVTPANGFTGTVLFSASLSSSSSGVVPGVGFSPSSVSVTSSTAVSVPFTVTLTGLTAGLRPLTAPGRMNSGTQLAGSTPHRPWYRAAGSGVAIASLLLIVLPRRRRLGGLLLFLLAAALIGGATGCGGASNGTISANTNPDLGIYVVKIVATYTNGSTTLSQSTPVTFNVN